LSFKILIPEEIANEGKQYLIDRGYELKIGRGIDTQTLIEDLDDCDGIIVRVAPMNEEVIRASKKLKVIAKHGVGVDTIDIDAAKRYGKRVVNVPNANTISVAEHAFSLILACAKKIPFMAKEYQNNNFSIKDKIPCTEVSEKTLGLIGLGRIGSSVAKMAKNGFDMKVLAYDPYIPNRKMIDEVYLTDSWEKVFRESDFISIHIPANKDTNKIISSREFELMKTSAYIINTARGQIIDEIALIKALEEGQIAGAGLDVSDPEPAKMDNPLLKMDNVIMTPHNAASTKEALIRMAVGAAMGIDEILTNKKPQWPIV
jgi:D-3-phosphoglycerate dehydrogenase